MIGKMRRILPMAVIIALAGCTCVSASENETEQINETAESAADVVEIGTAEELVSFAKSVTDGTMEGYVGKTVVLTSDIDCADVEWTPAGTMDLNDIGGLCGYSGTDSVGDIALATEGVEAHEYPAIIRNCHVTVKMNVPGATHVGGLIGTGLYYYGEETAFKIVDCSVNGEITGAVTPGSVAGRAENSIIESCEADVTLDGKTLEEVGETDRLLLCTPGGQFSFSDMKDNTKMAKLFEAKPDNDSLRSIVLGMLAMFMQFFGYLALGIWMRQYSTLWANMMIVSAAMIYTFGLAHHILGCAAE